MKNQIFINKKTKEEYIALPTNNGQIKLFSLNVDDGSKDIIIDKEDFNKNYIEETEIIKTTIKIKNIFKGDLKMKVTVLTWGKQDEMGRVFYDDTHVELFKTEEAAQARALELGREFVPEASNTEELVEGLIELDDKEIPNMNFDIDIINIEDTNRMYELLNNTFGYLTELISNDEERKNVLINCVGLTEQELDDFGFCFE